MRAGIYTFPAADALTAVRSHGRIDIHLAGFRTGFAADAFVRIKMQTVKGDLIEETVDCAQRADIFAERPVYDKACRKDQTEYHELETEKIS